jgi:chaperonin cofactor prefoldin
MNSIGERKFDYVNFFYGVGAAIILVAAMFKFLGWNFGDILFIIGLTTEAVIFLISSFEYKYYKQDYNWDKVFPQLKSDTETYEPDLNLLEKTQEQQITKIMESLVVLHSSVVNLNTATKRLSDSIEKIDKNFDVISESTNSYQKELNNLREKLASANNNLKDFDNFKI